VIDGLDDARAFVKPPRFESGNGSDVVLAVEWLPAQSFYHPDMVGIHVSVYPVRSLDRAAARSAMRAQDSLSFENGCCRLR
jgi:hypothetical protein